MARRGRCAPARSTAKSPTAFAANGAPRSTPISDPSSKPHGEDRSEPSTPSASPLRAAPCLAQLENVNGDLSNYLVDVLEAIKDAAAKCGVTAERVDEVETNERITDRILESIIKAQYVIVDLTKERPNVFFEAGFAHGLGKVPVYVARHGTPIHFDIKDYPVIMFRNMAELKAGIRLSALSKTRNEH